MQIIQKLFGASRNYEHINVGSYRKQFKPTGHTLVDVRSRVEYRQGHLPGRLNIPLNELQGRVSEVPAGKPVVVVCASGNRSRTGASIFARAGFENVYNLQGGTSAWVQSGYPLE